MVKKSNEPGSIGPHEMERRDLDLQVRGYDHIYEI